MTKLKMNNTNLFQTLATTLLTLLVMMGTSTAQAQTVVTYYHTDALGSPVAATDQNGNLLWRENYAPYGQKLDNSPEASGDRVAYTGKLHDDDTGLSYLNARYYDPVVGWFMAIDPVGPLDGGVEHLNRYVYVYNNPYKYTDPTGLIGNTVGDDDDPKMSGIGGGGVSLSETMPGISLGRGTTAPSTAATGVNKNVTDVVSTRTNPIEAQKPVSVTNNLASQLAKNKAAGDAFEKQVMGQLQKTQSGVVQQVTVKTQSGVKTRIDLMSRDANANIVCTECKASATAPLTKNQTAAFPEIQQTGATIVGQGKPGFPGGTQIPPTTINIVRPE